MQTEVSPQKKYSREDIVRIQAELIKLQYLKGQVFSEEKKEALILQFENISMPVNRVIERINAVSVIKTYGEVQFSDFIDLQIDDIIPCNVVYNRAIELVNFNQEKFNELCLARYGNKLITRAEKDYITTLLTQRELSYTDLHDVQTNRKYLEEEEIKIQELRKRVHEGREKLREETAEAIKTALEASGIPEKYRENIIRFELERVRRG